MRALSVHILKRKPSIKRLLGSFGFYIQNTGTHTPFEKSFVRCVVQSIFFHSLGSIQCVCVLYSAAVSQHIIESSWFAYLWWTKFVRFSILFSYFFFRDLIKLISLYIHLSVGFHARSAILCDYYCCYSFLLFFTFIVFLSLSQLLFCSIHFCWWCNLTLTITIVCMPYMGVWNVHQIR